MSVRSTSAYPNAIAALADTVMRFFVDDSNWNIVLQQCKGSNEPRWATAGLKAPVSTVNRVTSQRDEPRARAQHKAS